MSLTNLDGLKKLYKKMTGKTSAATNTAEAIDEIANTYTKSDSGTNAMNVLSGWMSETSGFISATGSKYTVNGLELGEINQLYVTSGAGTTASTVFKATGSGYNKTGTLMLPVIYTDSSDNEVVGWYKYRATSKLELNDEGDGGVITTFSYEGSSLLNSDSVPMKFANVAMNKKTIEV